MNKSAAGNGSMIFKGICFALVMALGVSLFAAGVSAESGCGQNCKCHSNPIDLHHLKGKRIPSSAGTCSGNPMTPCDLESSAASGVPEFVLVSAGSGLPNTFGSTSITSGHTSDKHNPSGYELYQVLREKSRSAPTYLQNSSLLI